MRQTGWMDRPNVRVLEGKWQDFVDEQLLEFGGFDVIYTDTFSEDYLGSCALLGGSAAC
jgi:protein arginine N-methyltransferase 2